MSAVMSQTSALRDFYVAKEKKSYCALENNKIQLVHRETRHTCLQCDDEKYLLSDKILVSKL